jgi:glycosyltransferase involved in cell wall biosynthesis
MRIAIVHEWLAGYTGSEKVLEQLLLLYPEADLFCVADLLSEQDRVFLRGRRTNTTFVQRLPFVQKRYRLYIPLMPLAVEQLDLGSYDLVISSSHAVAKGVLTGPDQLHICYCHTPIRYAWDLQHQYLRESGLDKGLPSALARLLLHYLRLWDARTAQGVDYFAANSSFIARRIHKAYRRTAAIIHPPVDTHYFRPDGAHQDYFVGAGRFVPYKRMDLLVEAFARLPDRKLVLIGDGPELATCRATATPNVQFLGRQPASVLRRHLQSAAALLFAAEEDFGIVPVEAQACGTPVICYGKGGVLDSVLPGLTGTFFAEQKADSLQNAIMQFDNLAFDPASIRRHALNFSQEIFREQFQAFVRNCLYTQTPPFTGNEDQSRRPVGAAADPR